MVLQKNIMSVQNSCFFNFNLDFISSPTIVLVVSSYKLPTGRKSHMGARIRTSDGWILLKIAQCLNHSTNRCFWYTFIKTIEKITPNYLTNILFPTFANGDRGMERP